MKVKLSLFVFVLFAQLMRAQEDRFAINVLFGPSLPLKGSNEVAGVGLTIGAGIEYFPARWFSLTLYGSYAPYLTKSETIIYPLASPAIVGNQGTFSYRSRVQYFSWALGTNVYLIRPEVGWHLYTGLGITANSSRHNVRTANYHQAFLLGDTIDYDSVEFYDTQQSAIGALLRIGAGYRIGDGTILSGEVGLHGTGEVFFVDRYILPRIAAGMNVLNISFKISFTL